MLEKTRVKYNMGKIIAIDKDLAGNEAELQQAVIRYKNRKKSLLEKKHKREQNLQNLGYAVNTTNQPNGLEEQLDSGSEIPLPPGVTPTGAGVPVTGAVPQRDAAGGVIYLQDMVEMELRENKQKIVDLTRLAKEAINDGSTGSQELAREYSEQIAELREVNDYLKGEILVYKGLEHRIGTQERSSAQKFKGMNRGQVLKMLEVYLERTGNKEHYAEELDSIRERLRAKTYEERLDRRSAMLTKRATTNQSQEGEQIYKQIELQARQEKSSAGATISRADAIKQRIAEARHKPTPQG